MVVLSGHSRFLVEGFYRLFQCAAKVDKLIDGGFQVVFIPCEVFQDGSCLPS
jgi:hypothetical protein